MDELSGTELPWWWVRNSGAVYMFVPVVCVAEETFFVVIFPANASRRGGRDPQGKHSSLEVVIDWLVGTDLVEMLSKLVLGWPFWFCFVWGFSVSSVEGEKQNSVSNGVDMRVTGGSRSTAGEA